MMALPRLRVHGHPLYRWGWPGRNSPAVEPAKDPAHARCRIKVAASGAVERGALNMDAVVQPAVRSADGEAAPRPLVRPTRAEAEAAVRTLFQWAGDDPDREGLRDTPARVAKAWRELFKGYEQSVSDEL